MNNIAKIIQEEFKKALDSDIKGEGFYKTFQIDIPYLKNFKLLAYNIEENNTEVWQLGGKYENQCDFNIIIKHPSEKPVWSFEIDIKGDMQQGGYAQFKEMHGYDDFATNLRHKLSNNFLWKIEGFTTDTNKTQDVEIIKQIKRLIPKKDKLFKIKNKDFDDLKKLYNITNKYNVNTQQKELIEDLFKNFKSNMDKDKILKSVLAKIDKIDYYINLEKFYM